MDKKKKWTVWAYESIASEIYRSGRSTPGQKKRWGEKSTQSSGATLMWTLLDEKVREKVLELMLSVERRASANGTTVVEEMRKMRDAQGRIKLSDGSYLNLLPEQASEKPAGAGGKSADQEEALALRAAAALAEDRDLVEPPVKAHRPSGRRAS